jgi:hypothetical protein
MGGVLVFNLDSVSLAEVLAGDDAAGRQAHVKPEPPAADQDEEALWQLIQDCQGKCTGTRSLIDVILLNDSPGFDAGRLPPRGLKRL